MVQFHDRLMLDKKQKSPEGFLRVHARAARTGIYDYLASEVGAPDSFKPTDTVKIYRAPEDVFDKASLASFIGKPITNDHPTQAVTADNWKSHAGGTIFGAVKDGDYVGFDLAFMDSTLINALDSGKSELSNGYGCDLVWGSGTTPDGQHYDARQTNIRGNHTALVDRGRAGPDCAVKDFAVCDALPQALEAISKLDTGGGFMPHTLTIDGLQVPNVSDEAKACIEKLQGVIKDSADAQASAKTAHDKEMAAKDAEIDKLKSQVVDEATIDARAAEKADVLAAAKPFIGDADTAGKSVADIKRMAVAKGVNDEAVKDKSDDYVAARFDALCDSGIVATQNIGAPVVTGDSASLRDAARDEYIKRLTGKKESE